MPKRQHIDFATEAEANTKRAGLQREHGEGYLMCVKELAPPVTKGAKKSRQGAIV
jgi:hypothetical protein